MEYSVNTMQKLFKSFFMFFIIFFGLVYSKNCRFKELLGQLSGKPEVKTPYTTQKMNFCIMDTSVNVTKSAVSCGFGHIY